MMMIRRLRCSILALALLGGVAAAEPAPGEPLPNALSAEEAAAGFRLLFDGSSSAGWTGFGRDDFPGGWVIDQGSLHRQAGGGDIATAEQFGDFELRLQWRIGAGGNSGIFYRSVTGKGPGYKTGHEMQVLDNAGHRDGKNPLTSAGSVYGLYAPAADVTRPLGQWNDVRLVVRGQRVEHWLNGTQLASFEIGSDDWRQRLATSKFKDWDGFGVQPAGHIVLQDHGDPVWYRAIRIRELGPE